MPLGYARGCSNVETSCTSDGSKITMSAAIPTAIRPLSVNWRMLAGSELIARTALSRLRDLSSRTYFANILGNVPNVRGCAVVAFFRFVGAESLAMQTNG